jgi:hypothetical protein
MILIIPTWGPTTLLEERSRSIHNLPYPWQREQLPDGALLPFSYSGLRMCFRHESGACWLGWHLTPECGSSSQRRFSVLIRCLPSMVSSTHISCHIVTLSAVDGFKSTYILLHCQPFREVNKKDFIFISGSLYNFRIYTYEKLWSKAPGDR